jgi:hypothetical protein
MDEVEKRVIGKVMRRLIPFLILCYFVAYLDRVNVGFAKLHMNQALGFSEAAFGLGAGLFFIAYFLFEVPSNLFLERVGARVWIARIMISWGIVSAAFAFIPQISHATGASHETVFYTLRLLLGGCEAGFFPGIIFYLTLWFPAVYRARVISFFMLAIPISSIVGSPISGMLLNLSGWGLVGWQWLFILEAVPSILVGLGVLFYLTDFPRQAGWLQPDEIAWLENVQATEKKNKEKVEHLSLLRRCLLPADHHQGLWGQRYPDRAIGCSALSVRCRRHGVARPALGSHDGAKRPRRRGLADGGDRGRTVRACFQSRPHHGIALLRADRHLGGAADVLAVAGEFPDRRVGRGGDRGHQLAGQSVRLRRPVLDGLHEGSDWKLHGRAAAAGGLCVGWRRRLCHLAHRPEARAGLGATRAGALSQGLRADRRMSQGVASADDMRPYLLSVRRQSGHLRVASGHETAVNDVSTPPGYPT